MVKLELGIKRICCACGTRFYDLNKMLPVCPKCGTEQPIELPRHRQIEGSGNLDEEKEIDTIINTDDLENSDADVDDVIEDASDLEDDVDAIGSEIEAIKNNDDDNDS